MSHVSRRVTLATAAVLLLPTAALAQPTLAGAPPAGSTVIDFNALPVGTEITTQFAALGVTISGGACTNGAFTGSFFTSQQVTNFTGDGTTPCGGAPGFPTYPALTFTFTTPITYFGVDAVVSNGNVNLIFATSNGTLAVPTPGFLTPPAQFRAIQDATPFTTVTLSTGLTGAFAIDNLTFATAAATVPEPGTWAMLGTGLLAVAGMAARRKRRTV